jgi:hypothetical protein
LLSPFVGTSLVNRYKPKDIGTATAFAIQRGENTDIFGLRYSLPRSYFNQLIGTYKTPNCIANDYITTSRVDHLLLSILISFLAFVFGRLHTLA